MIGNSRGYDGESIAARYLEKKGYKITARNYHTRFGELDIVCENKKYIVIVEVKTRREGAISTGREAVSPAKIRKIIKSAVLFLQASKTKLQPRFDVVEITLPVASAGEVKIVHIENAFDGGQFGGFF